MTTTIFSLSSFAADAPIVVAQGSKSSGNEVVKSIEAGKDYKGMTKAEVVDAIGEP